MNVRARKGCLLGARGMSVGVQEGMPVGVEEGMPLPAAFAVSRFLSRESCAPLPSISPPLSLMSVPTCILLAR